MAMVIATIARFATMSPQTCSVLQTNTYSIRGHFSQENVTPGEKPSSCGGKRATSACMWSVSVWSRLQGVHEERVCFCDGAGERVGMGCTETGSTRGAVRYDTI